MLKKTFTYEDYNGVKRTEDFWFNLTKAEIMEMEMGVVGGLSALIKRISAAQDSPTIINIFKDLILKAYGEKSADGRRFIKNDEIRDSFAQTEAYSMMFMELATNTDAAIEFINGIIPADASEELKKTDINKLVQLPEA